MKWRNTIEYLSGLDEFMNCAINYMKSTGEQTLLYPCCDCQNLRRFHNVNEVRGHLTTRGFMRKYTKWIWYGETFERTVNVGISRNVLDSETEVGDQLGAQNVENLVPETIVHDEIGIENVGNISECVNNDDHLDEMINDMEEECVDNPEIISKLFEISHIPFISWLHKIYENICNF
jgi:Transposase-associated domain